MEQGRGGHWLAAREFKLDAEFFSIIITTSGDFVRIRTDADYWWISVVDIREPDLFDQLDEEVDKMATEMEQRLVLMAPFHRWLKQQEFPIGYTVRLGQEFHSKITPGGGDWVGVWYQKTKASVSYVETQREGVDTFPSGIEFSDLSYCDPRFFPLLKKTIEQYIDSWEAECARSSD